MSIQVVISGLVCAGGNACRVIFIVLAEQSFSAINTLLAAQFNRF